MAIDINSIKSAFESSAAISPKMISVGFYAISLGFLLAFGISVILKKANRGGNDEDRNEFIKISVTLIICIILFLLYSAFSTIG